jgi:signal transduction histidine kinase
VITEVHGSLPPDVKIALYRVAQEALNNVVKHARANHVVVSVRDILDKGEAGTVQGVELRITDDGCGFDATSTSAEHLGLDIMRERADGIGAKLSVDSKPNQGTQVTIVWHHTQ